MPSWGIGKNDVMLPIKDMEGEAASARPRVCNDHHQASWSHTSVHLNLLAEFPYLGPPHNV